MTTVSILITFATVSLGIALLTGSKWIRHTSTALSFILCRRVKIALIECTAIEDFSMGNPCTRDIEFNVVVNLGAQHNCVAANVLKHLGHCFSSCPTFTKTEDQLKIHVQYHTMSYTVGWYN